MIPLILAALLAAPAPMIAPQAQDAAAAEARQDSPPDRIRNITVYGSEPCPKAGEGEVVVCTRKDAEEQFRIPEELRETEYTPAKNSWTNKAEVVTDVSREAAGLPDNCSPVGTGGQTGCFMEAARQAAAERRQQQREQESSPWAR